MSDKIYLYLGKRDKKGVKVVTILTGPETPMARVTDLASLNLPPDIYRDLADIIHQHRIEWEPWVESVGSYQDLKAKLSSRGYVNLPIHSSPLYRETSMSRPPVVTPPEVKKQIMVQRPKSRK